MALVAAASPGAGDLVGEGAFEHGLEGFVAEVGEVGVPGAGERLSGAGAGGPSALPVPVVFCADQVPSRMVSLASLVRVQEPRAELGLCVVISADHAPRKIFVAPAEAVQEPRKIWEDFCGEVF